MKTTFEDVQEFLNDTPINYSNRQKELEYLKLKNSYLEKLLEFLNQ
nr:hypothetical protein [uncultured Psychroserpens sp.]